MTTDTCVHTCPLSRKDNKNHPTSTPDNTNERFERLKRTSGILERGKPFLKKQSTIFYKFCMTNSMN